MTVGGKAPPLTCRPNAKGQGHVSISPELGPLESGPDRDMDQSENSIPDIFIGTLDLRG